MISNKLSKKLGHISFGAVIIFFLSIIFLPAVYVLRQFSFNGGIFTNEVLRSVFLSFGIALIVTLINLVLGLPLAWWIVRSKFWLTRWLDNLIDLSLVMPTAALGFSVYLYWGTKFGIARLIGLDGGLISEGPMLIVLLHVVFTLPYMVRSVMAEIAQLDLTLEEAAVTLSAKPFTIFRTVSLPLFKNGIIVGSILSFTRSISETGATMIVAGTFVTAPVLIVGLKNLGAIPQAAGASIILIVTSVALLFVTKLFLGKKSLNLQHAYPNFEGKLPKLKNAMNTVILLIFIIFVFLPTIFIALYNVFNFQFFFSQALLQSLLVTFGIAFVITFVSLIFTAPLAYIIARNRYHLGKVLDTLNEVVLLVPTSALGLSLALFWHNFLSNDLLTLALTHLSFSFPLLVKPVVVAIKDVSKETEEAAATLGASARKMFVSILLPQIKPALIAGSIMVFMRSLSETGATLAVTKNIKTIPVYIVELVKSNQLNQAAFVSVVLFALAIMFLTILKYNKKKM